MSQTTQERDAADLARFGYQQRLDRTLGGFSAFAAGFSYLSVMTGSSQFFPLGYASAGPAFFWTWPTVLVGQGLVALCFAELAARYPLSGGVYPWSKRLASAPIGWLAGWIYMASSIITLGSTALALQAALPAISPWFQIVGRSDVPGDVAKNAVLLALGLVSFTTVMNAVGLRMLARVNNAGVFIEMIGVLLLIVLLSLVAQRGPGVVFDGQGHGAGQPWGMLGPMLAGSLMATFVLYGFDTAGTLAEETDDPRRRAPRAILLATVAVGVSGSLLVFVALRAAPDLNDPALGRVGGGLARIVTTALGSKLGAPFLAVMACSIIVCTLTVHAAAVRLIFAMARDNALPFAHSLARVEEGTRTLAPCRALVVGVVAAGLLVLNINYSQVIEALASIAVVWANLAYLFVTASACVGRGAGVDPRSRGDAPSGFQLGRWGLAVNLAAVIWGILVVLNIGWPRPEVYGEGWLGRYGAAPATLAMVAAGGAYLVLIQRRRGGVLAEHSAPAEGIIPRIADSRL